jgi:RNA exonuclease 4
MAFVVFQVDTTPQQLHNNNKKRCRCSRKNPSETSSTSSHESNKHSINEHNPNLRRRRRKRTASNSNNKKNSCHQQQTLPVAELSEEEKARFVALDCEMVGVDPGGYRSISARVTCVGWDGNTLLDVFVRPEETVTDYRTFVSGITAEDLESEDAIPMDICRIMVEDLLQDKILVGHALKNDLAVLGIHHPWYNTRDTGKYEPFMKVRFAEDGILWPRKLKDLAKNKLGREIQVAGVPHSPYEDAKAAMDLYKRACTKWQKAMEYKINKTRTIMGGEARALPLAQ